MEIDAITHFYQWLWQASIGLLLIGAGLSLLGHAAICKSRGENIKKWFIIGTLSLVVTNAGLCFFADSIKHRIFYELKSVVQK